MKLEKKIAIVLTMLFCSYSYGQKFLALDKRGKVKRIYFYQGSQIVLRTKADSLIYGTIQLINDSSFIISNQTIMLSEIKVIQSPKENFGLALLSKLTFIAGFGYFALDSGNRLINNESPFIQKRTLKTSAIYFGIASFSSLISSRKYRINKRHNVKIIDLSIE